MDNQYEADADAHRHRANRFRAHHHIDDHCYQQNAGKQVQATTELAHQVAEIILPPIEISIRNTRRFYALKPTSRVFYLIPYAPPPRIPMQ